MGMKLVYHLLSRVINKKFNTLLEKKVKRFYKFQLMASYGGRGHSKTINTRDRNLLHNG